VRENMTPERWQQIRELLHGAMQIPVAERSAFLDSKCSNDPTLRKEVQSFLSADGEVSQQFLERPIAESIIVRATEAFYLTDERNPVAMITLPRRCWNVAAGAYLSCSRNE